MQGDEQFCRVCGAKNEKPIPSGEHCPACGVESPDFIYLECYPFHGAVSGGYRYAANGKTTREIPFNATGYAIMQAMAEIGVLPIGDTRAYGPTELRSS